MKLLDKLISVLGIPAAYRLFFLIVGGDVRKIYTTEYVKAKPGEKVLDIGCGPGDILEYLPDVKYTGFDLSPEYIEAAKKRFGNRGRFFCNDVGLTALEEEIMALKESLAAQGITTMPRNIDPWRERARRRLPESPYEGEMPY